MRLFFLFFSFLFLLIPHTWADEDWQTNIPESLRPWVPWAIKEQNIRHCPFAFNSFQNKFCSWPANLALTLNKSEGKFILEATVSDEAWVPLPGNEKVWPQTVQVNGRAYEVVAHNGTPSLYLDAGSYRITGEFSWNELPASLPLALGTGIVSLMLDGKDVPVPTIDGQGNLWLKQKEETLSLSDADQLETKVFRHLTDSIPFEIQTHLVFHVSGKNREIQLKGALLPGFLVKNVQGMLPSRLEDDGTLRVKARPGTWAVDVTSYSVSPTTSIPLPAFDKTWPDNEIWVFEEQPALRVVDITGAVAIDPRQTELPQSWRRFPAYLLKPKETLTLKEKKRGDSEPQPDTLSLTRELWLDFNGKGYTAKDNMNGVIHQSSRISAGDTMVPGRVSVNGQDQFITTVEGDNRLGVEVQRGQLLLSADSRIEKAKGTLNAVGWAHDVNNLAATLYLPPGWRLFAAGGIDKVSTSWINDWTLFDIFLVLFATIALFKLLGVVPGLVGLATLVLVHTELPGLGWLALFITAMVALQRVLPQGWFHKAVGVCRWAAIVFLVLLMMPFMLYHMRDAIHPQLKGFYYNSTYGIASSGVGGTSVSVYGDAYPGKQATVMESLEMPSPPPMAAPLVKPMGRAMEKTQRFQGFYQYDPSVSVQTGFGVANWRGERINLVWNGPVTKDQNISLWLLSPWMNLVLACIRVVLLLGLLAVLLEVKCDQMKVCMPPLPFKKTVLPCLLAAFVSITLFPLHAKAEETPYPPAELLKELKSYVTTEINKAPECMPLCADIAEARLHVEGRDLMLYLAIHAAGTTAVPLPDTVQSWHIQSVAVNGKESNIPLVKQDNVLWVGLEKGVHDVVITGTLPERDSVSIQFPLKPHHAVYQAEGWEVHGIHEDGTVDQGLQLVRLKGVAVQEEEAFPATRILPFFKVERTLSFGTSWNVDTRITRLTPRGTTAVVSVPLLAGESVTSQDRQIKEGNITVQMSPEENEFTWSSLLKQTPEISLKAPGNVPFIEAWNLQTTNLWHVETDGIARILSDNPIASWRPLAGESLIIHATKPEGVPGPTKTVDNVTWQTNVGKRALDTKLSFTLRSSKGDQHTITLPEKAVLESLTINQIPQPLQQEGGHVSFPLSPGSQEISLSFKQPSGIKAWFKTPEVKLGLPSVNIETVITMPQDRWVLLTHGPKVGPAILFWGVFPVIVALAFALGMVKVTPLRFRHWLLLLLGLSQATLAANVLVAGWLLAIGFRQHSSLAKSKEWLFNARQIILGFWAAIAVISLFIAIKHGLLGTPDMKITGNGSSPYYLKWYHDMTGDTLPRPAVFSISILYFRFIMLAWALWLAFAFTGWLKWGWKCFSEGGVWRSLPQLKAQNEPKEEIATR